MRLRTWLALLLLTSAPLWAGLNFAVGPGGGLALPLGGNIRNYQPALDAGLDVRLTGFQPVVGLMLTGGYLQFKGPSSSNPANDSSKFTYRYYPTALCAFTDFSGLMAKPVVRPYLRLGIGPCYWDLRYNGQLLTTLDTSQSGQLDYNLVAGLGAEYRLPKLPLAVFAEFSADYITSTHFEKYSYLDKDEYFTLLNVGLRVLIP